MQWCCKGCYMDKKARKGSVEKMIDEILDRISPEEALEILRRLAKKDSDIEKQIEKETAKLLEKIDLEEICEEVFSVLDGIDVHELWDRAGPRTDGYSSPDEMAAEMIEEELDPYNKKLIKYLKLGMAKEAKLSCMGILKGIYRYVQESKSEFKDWAIDIPEEYFGYLLKEWKNGTKNKGDLNDMNKFLEKECSSWTKWAVKI